MTAMEPRVSPRRWERLTGRNPIAVALALSFVIHLALFGTYKVGKHFGWWNTKSEWLVRLTKKLIQGKPRMTMLMQPTPKAAQQPAAIPLTFVEVDPATALAEAPPDAKYYSSKNAKAQNPDPAPPKNVPKVDGKQTQVVRLEDNQKSVPFPLQPSRPQPETPPEPETPEPKPKGGEKVGDLAFNKNPNPNPKPPSDGVVDVGKGESPTVPKDRPRTLAQARAAKGLLVGEKMKQQGGVERRGKIAFDTKATAFGAYDAEFIKAVENAWHNLLENNQLAQRSGRVVLEFKLNADGRITNMKVDGNEVGELLGMLCQRAVQDPAPYARWPADMRRVIGSNTRDIRFTFFYN
jgi:outer membrane biosynthesis protein TonB